jgi:Zn-dependent protease
VFGIDIRVHVSIVIIFALITASLGSGVLPQWHPGWTMIEYWGGAIVATFLFFASLLIHELAHCMTAKSRGVGVKSITLFLLGGLAQMEREPPTPKDEFLIAGAGPLASLMLAMAFAVLAALLIPAAAWSDPQAPDSLDMSALTLPATVALWLASVNFMLAVFNMLPGFPLDGGRLFRAAMWWRTGDIVVATKQAAKVGRFIGLAIMALGTIMAVRGNVANGLWLVLIGWFLHRLAEASASHLMMERALAGFDVRGLMRTRFERVPDTLSVQEFVDDYLLRSSQVLWPVSHAGVDVGFLSATDLSSFAADHRVDAVSVRDCMHALTPKTCLSPNEDARRAFRFLADRTSPAPVLDNGHIVGIIHHADILRWLSFH